MGKKSLADELAELSNPAPTKEIDPERDVFQDGPALEASDDELLGAEIAKGSERRRLHGDIILDDNEYAGYPSSRSAIFDEYSENGSDDGGSPEEAIESESGDISSPASSNAEEHSDSGMITTEGERERNESVGVESEVAALEQAYLRSREDDADALSALKERAERERRKALAVAAQKKIWNCGLEIRILIQRLLQGANRLPQPRGRSAVTLYDPQTDAALQGLSKDATDALGDVLAILEAMESANPNVRHVFEASKVAGVKRSRGELSDQDDVQETEQRSSEIMWERLDSVYKRFSQYRDASIDRWHRKTVLSSGIAARGGLRALNQSVSSQVLALMRDSERAVERTRMPIQQCSVLCSLPEEKIAPSRDTQASEAIEDARDPETYDDTEFYQTLLKEFLEGKNVDSGSTGASWYSSTKRRRLVDRRASKGRKIRYHIHEKLVNFMTPIELHAPQFAPNVFANLFGRGSST